MTTKFAEKTHVKTEKVQCSAHGVTVTMKAKNGELAEVTVHGHMFKTSGESTIYLPGVVVRNSPLSLKYNNFTTARLYRMEQIRDALNEALDEVHGLLERTRIEEGPCQEP